MRLISISVVLVFVAFILDAATTPLKAVQAPKPDEIDAMLMRVERNIQNAHKVTQIAKEKADAIVEQKVEEKKQLESKVEIMEMTMEVFEIPVPKSTKELMDQIAAEKFADSMRYQNALKLNGVSDTL